EDLLVLHAPGAMALAARVAHHLAPPTAIGAGLLHGEDAALETDLAVAVAGAAGLDLAVLRAAALAGLALGQGRDLDALLYAGDRLLQVQLHDVADVRAAPCAAPTTAAEDGPEDVAEDVVHVRRGATPATHAMLERGMAMGVIGTALARVGQDLVGLLAFLERGFRGGVPRVAVRVVLHRAAAIGLLQLLVAGGAGHAADFVLVACHREAVIRDSLLVIRGYTSTATRRERAGPGPRSFQPRITRHQSRLLVVLDLGELGVDHVVLGRATRGRTAGRAGIALAGGRGRRVQRLPGLLQRLGLGLDLGLVVALERGLQVGDRRLYAADHVARHLAAVFGDGAAGGVDQAVGLVPGLDQLLELLVFLAVRLGVGDHPLDLLLGQAR